MKTKFVSLFMLVIMISACASTGTQDVSIYDTPEDTPMEALAFADLSMFDKELSRAMKTNQREIEVAVISKFTTNEIPDRLGKWFYMVDKNDGEVEVKSTDPTKRGIPGVGAGISLMISAVGVIRDKMMYSPSKHYDATILYQPESGVVEKIIFKRRP